MTKGSKLQSTTEKMAPSDKQDIGQVVGEVLQSARDDNRLTCGLYESGLMLEMNPDSVMACVLPVNASDDVTLDIHFTLIEAFCLENAIRLLKVDSSEKIEKLLGDRTKCMDSPVPESTEKYMYSMNGYYGLDGGTTGVDFNCVLLEYPRHKCSDQEEELIMYHKETCAQVPTPVIVLVENNKGERKFCWKPPHERQKAAAREARPPKAESSSPDIQNYNMANSKLDVETDESSI